MLKLEKHWENKRIYLSIFALVFTISSILCATPIYKVNAAVIPGDDMEDISDWILSNSSNGAVSLDKDPEHVMQGIYSMDISVSDDNDGSNDGVSVYKQYASPYLNISSQHVMTGWFKTDTFSPYIEVTLTDSDGTVSKAEIKNILKNSSQPVNIEADKWYKLEWYFREYQGTVTGGDGTMNYSAIHKIEFYSSDGRITYMKTQKTNFYIDDISFATESDINSFAVFDSMDSDTNWLAGSGASKGSDVNEKKEGTGSLRFTAVNNSNGLAEYPWVCKTNLNIDFSAQYTLTFWVKTTQDLTFFNMRMTDTDQTSVEYKLNNMFQTAGGTLTANNWYKARFDIRVDPGTVTGGNCIMNFNSLKEIVFIVRDSELPTGINTNIYIDDVKFVKSTQRMMIDSCDTSSGWSVSSGGYVVENKNNSIDVSHSSIDIGIPNNKDGQSDWYIARKSINSDLTSYDVLSFWIIVSQDSDKLGFRITDSDGTQNVVNIESICWGQQLTSGKWYHVEWPFKVISDEISGGNGSVDYSNITSFDLIVDDNRFSVSHMDFSIDNIEAMTNSEYLRSKVAWPSVPPREGYTSSDSFQNGMYTMSSFNIEKMYSDMYRHGVDFVVPHGDHKGDAGTKASSFARKLGLNIVRQHFPVQNNNSLEYSLTDILAKSDSDAVYSSDPAGENISYLTANELEVYWPNKLQPDSDGDFSYFNDRIRYYDSTHGVDRRIRTHHINYLWYDTGEDEPWFMDWWTLGNYGGFKWVSRLKETAQRMGKSSVVNTQSWYPSNLISGAWNRNYMHVAAAPLDLDSIEDFKDSMWSNFEGGLNGIAWYIYEGEVDVPGYNGTRYNFVDNDGNPMNDRRWEAYSDVTKQIRATEGKPYCELTYPRSNEVIDKTSNVNVTAIAAASDASVASVIFEYNDGTNDIWNTIGSDITSPYSVAWDTTGLDTTKKYFVRARAFDDTHYSRDDVSSNIKVINSGGPVISNIAVSSNPTNGVSSLTVNCTAADSAQNISQVQYYIDTVQREGNGIPMNPGDGAFNSLTEGANATISIPSATATTPILVDDMADISDWSGAAARTIESGSLRMDVSNDNNGQHDYLHVIKDYGTSYLNLTNHDTLSFWLKTLPTDLNYFEVRMMDSDGTYNEAQLSWTYGNSTFPGDLWKNIRWNIKENIDWVHGGDGVFNYSQVKLINFYVDDTCLPTSGATQKIYIDDIRISAETRWSEQTSPVIFVRAKDAAGNWGPTSSAKLNVTKNAAGDTLGPKTIIAGTNPEKITDGLASFILTANIDDGIDSRGGTNITAAEFFLDTPGSNGTGTPMTAVDGVFDSMGEAVVSNVNCSLWGNNTEHTIYIHGRDAAGNWGPFYTEKIIKTEAQGPRIKNAAASPNPTGGQQSITIKAIADDMETGWGKITEAEYFVDTVGFEGTGTAMFAEDGTYSAIVEQVTATIDMSGLSTGYHTIYIHAKDSRSKWGPLIPIIVNKN